MLQSSFPLQINIIYLTWKPRSADLQLLSRSCTIWKYLTHNRAHLEILAISLWTLPFHSCNDNGLLTWTLYFSSFHNNPDSKTRYLGGPNKWVIHCFKSVNPAILCTLTARHTLSFHVKKFYDLHRQFQNTIVLFGLFTFPFDENYISYDGQANSRTNIH